MSSEGSPASGWRRVAVPPHVWAEAVDEEVVLLNDDSEIFFSLTGVGRVIWGELADSGSEQAAAERVASEFDVEEATAFADVKHFVDDLLEAGLVSEPTPER